MEKKSTDEVKEVVKVKTCGKKTEVYTRVCGFFSPTSRYNNGKAQEFVDRQYYKM